MYYRLKSTELAYHGHLIWPCHQSTQSMAVEEKRKEKRWTRNPEKREVVPDEEITIGSKKLPTESSEPFGNPAQAAFLLFFFLSAGLGAGGVGVGSFLPFLLFLSFSGDDLVTTGVALADSLTELAAGLSPVLRRLECLGGDGILTGSGDDSDSDSSSTGSASSTSSSSSSSSSSSTGTAAIAVLV